MNSFGIIAICALLVASTTARASRSFSGLDGQEIMAKLTHYNVTWETPSQDATGSMPIGNGIMGANVWVDPSGTIHLLLARTDTWSEISRLLKLGEVTISLNPNPFADQFTQIQSLGDGTIFLGGKGLSLRIVLDPKSAVLYVTGHSQTPISVTASLESWRTTRRDIAGGEANSAWTMKDGPVKLFESGDHLALAGNSAIVYHRNEESCVDYVLGFQGLTPFKSEIGDPILHRTFGTMISGPNLKLGAPSERAIGAHFVSVAPSSNIEVKVSSACAVTSSLADFVHDLKLIDHKAPTAMDAQKASSQYWYKFWTKSYVYVTAPDSADAQTKADCFGITQSYILQRAMMAYAGKGAYPFKFNGSIFTVEPKWFGKDYDPDWRRWGDGYWWQNNRLPYWAMVADGDFDQMEPFFKMYEHILPLSVSRTALYYNAKGAYFPETISFFGTYANSDYGWDRKPGQAPGDFDAEWWKYAWNQGPELVQMMLDRYHTDPNKEFLSKQLIPMARQVVLFFDTFFPRDANGQLKLTPDQVVETYRNGVTNDTPCIAGLHATLPQLISLPGLSDEDKTLYSGLLKILPPVAVKDGRIMPAATFDSERFNIENAEFYAIWPFRVFGAMEGTGAIASKTFEDREVKDSYGWQYDGQTAALAGLTDEAAKALIGKTHNSNKHFRYPAMWGPNYDWLPDQTHGGNIMLTLQSMLLQTNPANGKVAVLPAFPKDWNVDFRLFSLSGHVESCQKVGGRIQLGSRQVHGS